MKKLISIVLAIVCMFCVCVSASAVSEVPQHTKDFLAKDAVSVSEEDGVYTYTYANGEIIQAGMYKEGVDENVSNGGLSAMGNDSYEIRYSNGVRLRVYNPAQIQDSYGRPCFFVDEYGWSFMNDPFPMAMGPVLSPGDEGYVPIVLDDSDNPGENNDSGETPDENNEKQSWFVSFIKAVINIFQRIVEFFRGLFQK